MFTDKTAAEIANFQATSVTKNSITFEATIIEKESTLEQVEYSIDNETWNICTMSKNGDYDTTISETVNNLNASTEYTIYLRTVNFTNQVSEQSITVSTESSSQNSTDSVTSESSSDIESEAEKNSKEQYANFEAILNNLYPYGYKLGLDYTKTLETELMVSYLGYITIENEYGNKTKYEYGVVYDPRDNSVTKINVNHQTIYEK